MCYPPTRVSRRFDFFWFGAGGLLVIYGANELIAWLTSHQRVWLGGWSSPVGAVAAILAGLLVIVTLGLPKKLAPADAAAIATERADADADPSAGAPSVAIDDAANGAVSPASNEAEHEQTRLDGPASPP